MIQHIIFLCSVISFVSASRIVFPEVDNFPTECKLQDGTNGTCLHFEYCASSLTAKNVSTCYFEGPQQFVCCKNDLWKDMKRHRLTEDCGVPRFEIVKGIQTEYEEFPYMAALGWDSVFADGSYDYKCGGVLISSKHVLTAAHCAQLNGLAPSVVLVGGRNLTDLSAKPLKVAKVFNHPEYNTTQSYHDIAVLELEENALKERICIWSLYPVDNLNLTTIGYGHTQFAGLPSETLLKTHLTIVPKKECNSFYSNEDALPNGIVDEQICAKDFERGSDTCQGDSGGPLILFTKSSYGIITPFVVGITSFGRACALDPPGVYTRVSEYIDWIDSILNGEKEMTLTPHSTFLRK